MNYVFQLYIANAPVKSKVNNLEHYCTKLLLLLFFFFLIALEFLTITCNRNTTNDLFLRMKEEKIDRFSTISKIMNE